MSERILLVTGASSEIGMTLLEEIGDQFDHVIAQYRRLPDRLQRLAQASPERFLPVQADLAEEDGAQRLLGGIRERALWPTHFLHLPSGSFKMQRFIHRRWEEFQEGMDISLRSAVQVLDGILPEMEKNNGGQVVFMLSSCTLNIPPANVADYVTIKYAVLGLMKALAAEYAGRHITFNAVSPDMTDTKYLHQVPARVVETYAKSGARGRLLKVEEVTPTIAYLLSDGAKQVSGENICIGY